MVAAKEVNSRDEAKTQIKYAKQQQQPQEEMDPAAKQNVPHERGTTANEQESSALEMGLENRRNPKSAVATTKEALTTPARFETQTPHAADSAEVHGTELDEPSLYRIKLAEIVTDEFSDLSTLQTPAFAQSETKPVLPAASYKQANAAVATKQLREEYTERKLVDNINNMRKSQHALPAGKLNIVDLYPMKMEDFNPIIRDSNAKLLKERTIFTRTDDVEEHRQNLMPNEVEMQQQMQRAAPPAHQLPQPQTAKAAKTVNRTPDTVSDFTGKLLAEQDGVITEIEQKFRLNEFAPSETTTNAAPTTAKERATTTQPKAAAIKLGGIGGYSVNHQLRAGVAGHDFIDRRVKKSFDFPMHRTASASDVMAMPHIDFANTKFNTETSGNPGWKGGVAANGSTVSGKLTVGGVAAHPEFSTTKFYNSKELYNEMMQHNRQRLKKQQHQQQQQVTASSSDVATNRLVTVSTAAELPNVAESSQLPAALAETSTTDTPVKRITVMPTAAAVNYVATTTAASKPATAPADKPKKYQKEFKRAKLLLKAMLPATRPHVAATETALVNATTTKTTYAATATTVQPAMAAVTSTSTTSSAAGATAFVADKSLLAADVAASSSASPSVASTLPASDSVASFAASSSLSAKLALTSSSTASPSPVSVVMTTTGAPAAPTTSATTSATTVVPRHRTTNPTKSTSKPIVRPRILSRLQEKINSLECEIQSVPQDSHLWRGNETHELMLPIVASPENCKTEAEDCAPVMVSWEGEAEIQSGDILIVEINDALLNLHDKNNTNTAHNTQVYQVTRSGHEHCDVTEGILLDITPLVVDGRKLVTLYDKDLTEGVNLLIVVSELWGSQCVRLKVTAKTDNCGESAECSGKGVCYSNPVMEEYECQCCSGFAGPHCEEIDACTPSPCTNNGICVDLSQGHEGNSYQCLCPYGYTGKNCQYESDPCNSAECMNGGSCVGNSTHFRCDCTPGFTGPLCQHSLNECESSPCVHGICVDQEDGFRCFCQPGFAGELCNFEYNECESNPCQNDGECIDHIGSFECRCTKGYTGNRCQIKVDFCANKPCPEGHRCIDHGNDFSCECPGGRNGPDCNQMPRTQCNVNPCTHGGTCWSSGDSFYCACRPGYTGTMCEDEFVVETVVSSSEFIVDDTSARNFNDKTFGSSVVLKSPIELHNAYFAAGVLAAAIFIVAVVVTICHCKVNQTYRKFSTRSSTFFPILGFGRRQKSQNKLNKHWLSGKGQGSGNPLRSSSSTASLTRAGLGHHLPTTHATHQQHQQQVGGQLHERPFQRHLAMNLENDMYYTVDFSENSQHSPLIQ